MQQPAEPHEPTDRDGRVDQRIQPGLQADVSQHQPRGRVEERDERLMNDGGSDCAPQQLQGRGSHAAQPDPHPDPAAANHRSENDQFVEHGFVPVTVTASSPRPVRT